MHTPPILLPDAHAFSDVLEYVSEWDPAWPRDPVTNATRTPVPPRYIMAGDPPATDWERRAYRSWPSKGNEIGPHCWIKGTLPSRSICVRATDAVIDAVKARIVTPDDHLGFEIIGHADGRALVTLHHGYIIGSHWLAYIDPATIPAYPLAARDARISELCDAIRANGHTPFRRDLPGHVVEISSRDVPGIKSTVEPDGSSVEQWAGINPATRTHWETRTPAG